MIARLILRYGAARGRIWDEALSTSMWKEFRYPSGDLDDEAVVSEAGLRQGAADINRRLVRERLDYSDVMPRVGAFYRNVLRTDCDPGLVPLTHDWVGNLL